MSSTEEAKAPAIEHKASPWSPFGSRAFAVLWTATVVANIGSWMYSAAAGWLMTTLNLSPLLVSMVQTATALPMFLFALPAGALADILDRRKLLIAAEILATAVSAIFALIVSLQLATPGNLLLFVFLIGAATALTSPAWQAIVPQLVPRRDLQAAVAANSAGFNVSRAVGPALGGVIIAGFGIAAPFWLNALSNFGIIAALIWWRPAAAGARNLPPERFVGALRAGFRYAVNSSALRSTLMRGAAFFLFASAYWAFLPLIARDRIAGGPGLYGFLLGTIGAGAAGGAFALPWLKAKLGSERLVAIGSAGTALSMLLFGLARDPRTALLASAVAGICWIAVLATLNVSAQIALPEWVRGRGLSIYATVMFGSLSLGSTLWGQVAGTIGLVAALFIAAAGLVLPIPLLRRWPLFTAGWIDLTPSAHWPEPVLAGEVGHDRGPVLVTVEYRIDPNRREAFLEALGMLAPVRRRDGAYAWGVFEDAAVPGRMVETFLVESWLEHLRQHERVTNADRLIVDAVRRFHCAGEPTVTHFIAADRDLRDKR